MITSESNSIYLCVIFHWQNRRVYCDCSSPSFRRQENHPRTHHFFSWNRTIFCIKNTWNMFHNAMKATRTTKGVTCVNLSTTIIFRLMQVEMRCPPPPPPPRDKILIKQTEMLVRLWIWVSIYIHIMNRKPFPTISYLKIYLVSTDLQKTKNPPTSSG